jgi:hypothetical protein
MDLHQFQMLYVAAEDRVLLRCSFYAEDRTLHETLAWLTRRMVSRLWPTIVKSLQKQVALDRPAAAGASLEMVSMAHQASVAELMAAGKFGAPYDCTADGLPQGMAPLLVIRADFNVARNEPLRIAFVAAEGRAIEIAFQTDLLHAFCRLLQNAVRAAEWDIELQIPGETAAPDDARLLN